MTAPIPSEPRPYVDSQLNYLQYEGKRPVSYAYPPPQGVPEYDSKLAPQRVRIRNARLLSEQPALDTHGFELHQHASELRDFGRGSAITGRYYAEASALIARITGAEKVVVFDHTLHLDRAGHGEQGIREPARRVHNDQTFVSAPRRVRDHLPAEEAKRRLRRRFAIINLWRPIGAPVLSAPLAVCDARSIARGDLIASDLVYRDKVGETYAFLPNPGHRWFYFPHLSPDECLLLKIYDSQGDVPARLTAHTAFDDPETPPGAGPRRSIELRTLVFWPA